jgi:ATP-dependent RNA helicase DDX27
MASDDFIMTIDSDEEGAGPSSKSVGKASRAEDMQLDPDFTFGFSGDTYDDLAVGMSDVNDLVKKGSKPVRETIYRALCCIDLFL